MPMKLLIPATILVFSSNAFEGSASNSEDQEYDMIFQHWAIPEIEKIFNDAHPKVINENHIKDRLHTLDLNPENPELQKAASYLFYELNIRYFSKEQVLAGRDLQKIGYHNFDEALLKGGVEILKFYRR